MATSKYGRCYSALYCLLFIYTLKFFAATPQAVIENENLWDSNSYGNSATSNYYAIQNKSFCDLIAAIRLSSTYGYCDNGTPNVNICNGVWKKLQLTNCSSANLISISFNYMGLRGTLPTSLGYLSSLTSLDMSSNYISSIIPSSLGLLYNLKSLELSANNINGTIPSSLGQALSLTYISLHDNFLTGNIPSSIANLKNLTMLEIYQNSLSGKIPTSFFLLPNMQYIDMYRNRLTGTIPTAIGLLMSISYLDLGSNYFNGTLPATLGVLKKLKYLLIYDNLLTGGIPTSLGTLSRLLSLGLYSSSLSGTIPTSLGQLTTLTSLYLYVNNLQGRIPATLGKLTRLQYLLLDSNSLTGSIPTQLSGLKFIGHMYLGDNLLTGTIPSQFSRLSTIFTLNLASNKLNGTIPTSFYTLSSLALLDLSKNSLVGSIPEYLFDYSLFFSINFQYNRLTGTIPESLYYQIVITEIYLGNNKLSSTIPTFLAALQSLRIFDISTNKFFGTIPSNLLGESLSVLNIANNKLSGSVSENFCLSTSLTLLLFDDNTNLGCYATCLSGSVSLINGNIGGCDEGISICEFSKSVNRNHSLAYWNCSQTDNVPITSVCDGTWEGITCSTLNTITGVSVSDKSLLGTVPSSFGKLAQLTSLDLSNNRLYGKLPPDIRKLTALLNLYLNGNHFYGTIPPVFSDLDLLINLRFNDNSLTGTVPVNISGDALTRLDLSYNSFTGSVPASLCGKSLRQLAFNNNSLGCYASCLTTCASVTFGIRTTCEQTSVICDIIYSTNIQSKSTYWKCTNGVPIYNACSKNFPYVECSNRNLVKLSLGSLSLIGTIPSAISTLSALTYLNFSSNYLSGTLYFPKDKLSAIVVVDYSHNNISGTIPTGICSISTADVIKFSGNSLSGTIPTCFTTMKSLIVLALHNNSLYGSIPTNFNQNINLTSLSLQYNNLSGMIPTNLVGKSLTSLDLSHNKLTGAVPDTLCSSALRSLNLNDNDKLDCYPSCLTTLAHFTHSSLQECTIPNENSSDTSFSTKYIIIITVLLFVAMVILSSLLYICFCRKKDMLSIAEEASASILKVLLHEWGTVVLHTVEPYRYLLHGTLTFKDSTVAPMEVNIFISNDVSTRSSLQTINHIYFELHKENPTVFVKPFGYVLRNKIRESSNPTTTHPAPHEDASQFFSIEVLNSASVDSEHYVEKQFSLKEVYGGIVMEPKKLTLDSYLYITTESHIDVFITSSQQHCANLMDFVYYRQGIIATSLINIVTTGLKLNKVFSQLSLKQLMVFNEKDVKLMDISGVKSIGDTFTDLEGLFDTELTILELGSYSDLNYYILSPELAKKVLETHTSHTMGTDKTAVLTVSSATALWGLGILLFELFTKTQFSSCLYSDGITLIQSFATLSQEAVVRIVEKNCGGPQNYLRRLLLITLLKVDPSERPRGDELTPQSFLEGSDDTILFFFLYKHVPVNIIVELLDRNPEYSKIKNNDNLLPIQYALDVNADPTIITKLLLIDTSSCRCRFPEGNKSLLQYALDKNMSNGIIDSLLPYFMPIDKQGNLRSPEDHDFGWTNVLDYSTPPDKYVEAVSRMITEYSKYIKTLANSVDQLNRSALNLATPGCREEIIKVLYFLGIYDLKSSVEHQSKTCLVRLGIDTKQNRNVALKFMKHKDQFLRELEVRKSCNLSEVYVLGYLQAIDSDENEFLHRELINKGYSEYKYLLVMQEAERTLQAVISHEHVAGNDWDRIRAMSIQLTKAVKHVHDAGLIHGDIKPLNIMRVHGILVLIDMDACVSYRNGQFAGAKYSSAYLPPEMIHLTQDEVSGGLLPVVRTYQTEDSSSSSPSDRYIYPLLPAHPSYDMWSLGVTLFEVFTGSPLFRSNNQDNIDNKTMLELSEWTDSFKSELLAVVTDHQACNLLSQLLSKDPSKRPTTSRVLSHPFLSGKLVARMPGEAPQYDVFLSYRVAANGHHVEKLFHMLEAKKIKVWWDKVCLEDGKPWEEGFCNGLAKSMAFIPVLSREAINSDVSPNRQNFTHLTVDSPCDNVYLEQRLALELKAMGLIDLIYPVMIGDLLNEQRYTNYFGSNCHPNVTGQVVVHSVEEKVHEHLDRQGLGAPVGDVTTVSGVLRELLKNQGGFIEGNEERAFEALVDKIANMVKKHRQTNYNKKSLTNNLGDLTIPLKRFDSELESLKTPSKEISILMNINKQQQLVIDELQVTNTNLVKQTEELNEKYVDLLKKVQNT